MKIKGYETSLKNHRYAILALILLTVGTGHAERKSASLAMLLSIVPGGGQFYTEHYVAGIILGGGEITLGYFAYRYEQDKKYEQRNSMLWWGFFLFGYTLADSYVSAKMYGFDVETDIDKIGLKFSYKW